MVTNIQDYMHGNKPNHIYIGIDPGKSGAMAIILDTGKIYVERFDEGIRSLFDLLLLTTKYDHTCMLEKVHSFPGQGVRSTFNFGVNYGIWLSLLKSTNINYDLLPPKQWMQHYIKLGTLTKQERKNKFKSIAQSLYPNIKVTLINADAILIAHYCKITSNS